MARVFPTVLKKVIVQQAGGAPTFVYVEEPKRADGLRLPQLRISETHAIVDGLRITALRLSEPIAKVDVYRIPSATARMAESEAKGDRPQVPLLRTSSQSKKSDAAPITVLFQTPGTYSFVVPAGVTSLTGEGWGGGGGGGLESALFGGGGGKGGGYARSVLAVTPGETLTLVVAAARTAGSASPGIASTISRAATVLLQAPGGNVGSPGTATAGGAGATAQGQAFVGTAQFQGGNGAPGAATRGGGGGSGAGSLGAGNNGSGGTGGAARAQLGGKGGNGATATASGDVGGVYGGAAGGGAGALGPRVAPARGAIRLSFTV